MPTGSGKTLTAARWITQRWLIRITSSAAPSRASRAPTRRRSSDCSTTLHDPRLFVVIDEAHHAPAKSYRDAIKLLEKAKARRLLGLTATPTRTAEQERPELARLFGGRFLHQVSMRELIAKELLARPIPTTVKTKVGAETGMTAEDRAHVVTFHEP